MVTNKQPTEITEPAFQFAVRIVKLCRHLDEKPGGSRTLAKQLLRSETSIGANLEEGKKSQSEAEYLTKCSIACKEDRETLYWLKLLSESEIFSANRLSELTTECNELVAILNSIIKKLKERRNG